MSWIIVILYIKASGSGELFWDIHWEVCKYFQGWHLVLINWHAVPWARLFLLLNSSGLPVALCVGLTPLGLSFFNWQDIFGKNILMCRQFCCILVTKFEKYNQTDQFGGEV